MTTAAPFRFATRSRFFAALFAAIQTLTAGAFISHAQPIGADRSGGGPPGDVAALTTGPSVTIYSSADPALFNPQQFVAQNRGGWNASSVPGFGVVRDNRTLNITKGISELRFTDVARFIDPTTVSFLDMTDPAATEVLEQSFRFDLINPTKIYEKYVGKEIGLKTTIAGERVIKQVKLLAINGGQLVLMTDEGLLFMGPWDSRIHLPSLPADLISKPTLMWLVDSKRAGERKVQTSYMTDGLTWRADYNLVLNADDTKADLGAWVSLMNLSGLSYKGASLKLVAGNVRRIQGTRYFDSAQFVRSEAISATKSNGFKEKTFFEYHLYTLPRRTDVMNSSTQQITLFPTARGANVEKVLVYNGAANVAGYGSSPSLGHNFGLSTHKKVDVYIRFKNEKANNLGMPLPAGKVRVYKKDDADGALEFIGEDVINHTPKDENVLIRIGQSFDVVGERVQTDYKAGQHWAEETFRISVRNHREEAVDMLVRESLWRWSNWAITNESAKHEKINSRTIHFPVHIEPDGEQVVTYTVRYTW